MSLGELFHVEFPLYQWQNTNIPTFKYFIGTWSLIKNQICTIATGADLTMNVARTEFMWMKQMVSPFV